MARAIDKIKTEVEALIRSAIDKVLAQYNFIGDQASKASTLFICNLIPEVLFKVLSSPKALVDTARVGIKVLCDGIMCGDLLPAMRKSRRDNRLAGSESPGPGAAGLHA